MAAGTGARSQPAPSRPFLSTLATPVIQSGSGHEDEDREPEDVPREPHYLRCHSNLLRITGPSKQLLPVRSGANVENKATLLVEDRLVAEANQTAADQHESRIGQVGTKSPG